jgi:putative transposase
MARLKRLVAPGHAHHVVQRAVAGVDAFGEAADRAAFLEALRRSTEQGVAVHAYALRSNGFQLLVTPTGPDALGRAMQALSRLYVAAFNRRHGRSGALWQGRYRAAPVEGGANLLTCMRYIEQATGTADHGDDIAWSSAPVHAGMQPAEWLSGVPADSSYWHLGNTPFERETAYRALLLQPMAAHAVAAVESTTLKGWAMGSGGFLASLAADGRRPSMLRPGRPRNPE